MPIQANLTLAVSGGLQNGLITLLGVGLTVRPPQPQPMAVYALIFIPRQEAGRHRWRVELTYASGDPVRLARPIPGIPSNFVFESEADVRKVDGVIIVGRVGRNRRDVAQRLHETLTGAGAPLLGVVANGLKSGRRGGYGYSYDYAAGGGKATSADGGPPAGGASPNGATASDAPVPTSQG